MTINELRLAANMNIAEFSDYLDIPYRTVQNWDNGSRQCADYIIKLIKYKLEKENIINGIER